MINSSAKNSKDDSFSEIYNPQLIEEKWQKAWEIQKLYLTEKPNNKQKTFYALSMFPYPSGNLHMGHVRNYVITDVIARYHRMKGFTVLHPMGWDAFGLPAENAAIERGIAPHIWTNKNIQDMKSQLSKLGLSVDWERELTTSSSDYYKWTQYIFLELFNSGLAYQKSATVNWDPIDQTVLANEQVDINGNSWRSGAKVEKRKLKQWFLKITEYAETLLKDLDELPGWPERVRTMQANWIGKSVGAEITFKLKGNPKKQITVFTTRPDTLLGVSYLVLAPENDIVDEIIDENLKEKLKRFRDKLKDVSDIDRTKDSNEINGIFIGAEAINPLNNDVLPIWVADYVLEGYGTGAVMGVPAHDQRDLRFAKKYKLNIKQVISSIKGDKSQVLDQAYVDAGYMINSDTYNDLESDIFLKKVIEIGTNSGWCDKKVKYKLRDWLISRQRYWGCPIPIIHCKKCGSVPVEINSLPVELPDDINLSGKGESPLATNENWFKTTCHICKGEARKETDTMDTFMCSSWYFLRFSQNSNSENPFLKNEIEKWLPVDQYVGGIEHAILHLLYARFITKALRNKGLFDINEPFDKLLTQGMVQGITYKNTKTNKYIHNNEIVDKKNPIDPDTGDKLDILYEKMSKSKYNGVEPSLVINKFGADTARMFILFKAPPEKDLEWDDADVEGQYRFIQRLWKLINRFTNSIDLSINFEERFKEIKDLNNEEKLVRRSIHQAIKEITDDLDNGNQFNTAISELMKLTNVLNEKLSNCRLDIVAESLNILIKLLSPFAPHISEEFWDRLNGDSSIHKQSWPIYSPEALVTESYQMVIQVNGKFRGNITIDNNLQDAEIKQKCLDTEVVKKWLGENKPKRIILVKGKIINIVF